MSEDDYYELRQEGLKKSYGCKVEPEDELDLD